MVLNDLLDGVFKRRKLTHLYNRALQPPNWKQSWLVGVRVAANKKLVAFISGIPVALRTYEQ